MLAVLSAVILSFSAVSGCFLNVSASKLSLSAMAEETDFSGSEELIYVVGILSGYDIGCDDYIIKPFLLSALYSKCEALVRRAGNDVTDKLVCGLITLDKKTLRCFVEGAEVELPPKEFAILRYLLEHQDWVVTRDTLLDKVWGCDYFGSDRIVDNHIKKLRKALGAAGAQIKTIVGRGYKLKK